jgi:hypothetical protein
MHAGEAIVVRLSAVRSGCPVITGQVTAEFWAPGTDPVSDPAVRAAPSFSVPCTYDESRRRWTAQVATAGWAPGVWTVRGRVAGSDGGEGWAWQSLPLAA